MRTTAEEEKEIGQMTLVSAILNGLYILLCVTTLAICLWIRFSPYLSEWFVELNWYSYWYCVYCILVAMIFAVITGGIGLSAVIKEQRGMMLVFNIMAGLMILFHLVGAVVIVIWGVEGSNVLVSELRENFLRLIHEWDHSAQSANTMKKIQEYVGCCGSTGSNDYYNARKPVPVECRDMVTGSEYRFGCERQFAWWLEPWTGYLAGVSVFFVVINSINIWAVTKLRSLL